MTDISVSTRTPGEFAPGTEPRRVAEMVAATLANGTSYIEVPDSSKGIDVSAWAAELIRSLLHCLDTANAELNGARAGRPLQFIPLALAGKLGNLVHFNRSRIEGADNRWLEHLTGLAGDPELNEWARDIHHLIDLMKEAKPVDRRFSVPAENLPDPMPLENAGPFTDAVNTDVLVRYLRAIAALKPLWSKNLHLAADRLGRLHRADVCVREYPPLERVAQAIYDAGRANDPEGKNRPWMPGGNSHKQEEARQAAREALRAHDDT